MQEAARLRKVRHCQHCQSPLTSVQISRHQKFCSRTCKSESQKRKVLAFCVNCGRKFSIHPYLKKKMNYCSRECYWKASRRKQERACVICRKKFKVKKYLVKQGFGKFCSKQCQFIAYKRERIKIVCKNCGREFFVSPSVGKRKNFCSKQCKDDYERDYVAKICRQCKKKFSIPRWEVKKGKGRFCSRECFRKFNGETSIEKLMRQALDAAGVNFKQEVKIGMYYVDFLLPNTRAIIECDGKYWHSIPAAQKRDHRKDRFLTSKGYKIYRFHEHEIRSSAESCLKKIFQ